MSQVPGLGSRVYRVAQRVAPYGAVLLPLWFFLSPALGFEFASDDRIMIVENQYMRDPASWWRMISTDAFDRTIEGFRYPVESPVGHWRPVNKLSYLLDYTIWGPTSAGFHLTGILLHSVSACLALHLLRLVGFPLLPAVGGGLLFGLHPVSARVVGLVSLRADLWCGLFSLLAVVAAVRSAASPGGRGRWLQGLSWVSTLAALLGKETALILPVLFAMYWLLQWRRGSVELSAAAGRVWPYLAVVGLYAGVRFWVLDIPMGEQNEFPDMSAWTLFMSLSRLAASYLSELVAPTVVDRLWLPEILRGVPDVTVWVSWLALAAVAGLWWRLCRVGAGREVLGLGLVCLPVLLLLNINAISGEDVGELLPFEAHRLYIPTMGFVVLWSAALERARESRPGWRRPAGWAGLVALGLAIAAGFPGELGVYRNTETIVRRKLDNISRFADHELPTSLRILRLNLEAIELKRQKQFGAAEERLLRILELRPYDAVALKNQAVLALLQKDPDRAIECLQAVLNPVPVEGRDGHVRMVIDDPQLRHTGQMQKLLGQAYRMKGDLERAVHHLELALRIDPTDPDILFLLAWAAEQRGAVPELKEYLARFLAIASPEDPRRAFSEGKLRGPP